MFTSGPMLTMPDNVGSASTPNYGGNGSGVYEYNDVGGKGRVFAGQTDDAFFLDLRVFDLLYGANLSEAGVDSLAGFNVHSIAIQVPKSALRSSSPIIGVWATASRPTTTTRQAGSETSTGAFVQVSRMGNPARSTSSSFRSARRTAGAAAIPANEAPVHTVCADAGSAEAPSSSFTAFRRPPRRATISCRCS